MVDLKTYQDPATLPDLLAAGDTVDLIEPPLSMTRALVGRNLIAPLDEIVPPKDLADLRKEYFLMDLGSVRGQTYFLPRYLETPVLIYLKSQVAEAVQYWDLRKDEINRALAKHNGKGLPAITRSKGSCPMGLFRSLRSGILLVRQRKSKARSADAWPWGRWARPRCRRP